MAIVMLMASSIAYGQGPISGFYYPADEMLNSWQYYNNRSFYIYNGTYNNHLGADIDLAEGTAIKAIAKGKIVEYSSLYDGYGELVVAIEHELPEDITFLNADGNPQTTRYILSIYGHLRKSQERGGTALTWSIGQTVQQGSVIGYINNSSHPDGGSPDPNGDGLEHLHLGIRLSNEATAKAQDGGFWLRGYNSGSGMQIHFANPMPLIAGLAQFAQSPSWRTANGVSSAFMNRYNDFATNGHRLGFPWQNTQYGSTYVHEVNGMLIQDFKDRRDDEGPSNGYYHPYTTVIYYNDPWMSREPHLVKEGFWDEYMTRFGWLKFGAPVTDEYPNSSEVWQSFNLFGSNYATNPNDYERFYFTWDEGSQTLEVLDSNYQVVPRANLTVTNGGTNKANKALTDGVYHSGLKVSNFDQAFELIDGNNYQNFYASINGVEILMDPFVMNGDMTIVVSDVDVPVANFSATPMSGNTPLTVQFTDLSSGNTTSWLWNFGDGGTSTNQNPNHTYTTPGSYTVSLTATNSGGSDTVVGGSPIVVNNVAAPVANFSATPMSGYAPLTVQFTDLSSGGATSWLWDFGDGSTSTSQNPSHTYNIVGSYTVSLTASNNGGSDTVLGGAPVIVGNPPAPIAGYTVSPTSGVVPLTVQCTDTSVGTVTSWLWDFGDGSTSTSQNPSHIYNVVGVYTITLTVSNAGGWDSLQFIDGITTTSVSNLAPCVVSDLSVDNVTVIFVSGNYAYVADGSAGLKIIDVSVPATPTIVGSASMDHVMDVFVSGDYAYVADGSDGLKVVNISNPATPVIVGSVVTEGAEGLFVSGNYAYVADLWTLKVINISNPATPTVVGSLSMDWVVDVFVSGDYAYVADNDVGLKVVNISNPATPVIVGSVVTDSARDVWISGDYAYVADGSTGLKVVNISNPATPVIVGSVVTNGAIGVSVSGDYAYVADVSAGLKIIDVSDSTTPTIVGAVEAGGYIKDVFVLGDYIYLTEFHEAMKIVQKDCGLFLSADFTANPTSVYTGNPVQFTDQSTGNPSSWSWNFGNGVTSTAQNPIYAYPVHGTYTVSLTVGDGVTSDTLVRTGYITSSRPPIGEDPPYPYCEPNPSNPVSVIKFKVNQPGYVNLSIFDVQGRRVQVLVDQVLDTGVHQATFNGESFASGIYFYMIRSAEGTDVRKITLVK